MARSLAEERFHVWLEALSGPDRLALSERYRALSLWGGLGKLEADGQLRPIAPALTAAVEPIARLEERSRRAHALLSAVVKAARYFLGGEGRPLADQVFQGLSPWERELCETTWRAAEAVAIARVDLFTDSAGVDRPLEMNATIPAMEGYSDVAAQALLRAVGEARGIERAAIDQLCRENGSNTDDLRRSLVAHYRRLGGAGDRPSVALVARAGDPQSPELAAIARGFAQAGLEALRCTPDQIGLDAQGRATVVGRPMDLLYRHLFARRIDPESALGRIVREPERHRLLNPVNSQLEVKALFAELSRAAADPALARAMGLDEREFDAAARAPWSRRLVPGPATGPGGEALDDLVAFAEAHPGDLVVKRSWGYGGTSVVIGDDLDSAEGQARARDVAGRSGGDPVLWAEVVRRCAGNGGFVVQARVELATERHLVAMEGGPRWIDWYVDVSAYTNLGVAEAPGGGVRRGSTGRVVNIVGGGGLVPMIAEPVMEKLLSRPPAGATDGRGAG